MTRQTPWLGLALLMALVPIHFASAEMGDIVFVRKSVEADADYPPAIFPHFLHRIQFKCHLCHDAIFQMKAGANAVTMDAINEGKFCGTCHNGKTAYGVTFESCPRCHRP